MVAEPVAMAPWRLLLSASVVMAVSGPVAAQAVTATSGDPAVVAAVDATITAADGDTTRFRRVERALLDYSAEGGTLVAFYDGPALRKMSAYLTGHSGLFTQHFYYSADQLVFIHTTYDQHETKSRIEHRVYLRAEQAIRRTRTMSAARPSQTVADWDPLGESLRNAKEFVICAAGTPTTCTAPRR